MLNRLLAKIKEACVSVLPIAALVLILCLTPLVDLDAKELVTFVISTIGLILGISLFNLGADLGVEPMGQQVGSTLIKTKKMKLILIVCFVLGVLITIAEPDLSVLANQLKDAIPGGKNVLVWSIGVGVGVFLVIGVLKIITKKDLTQILLFFYMALYALVTILIFNGNGQFIALSFDSGGVTTGPITVPFIMALGSGFALTVGGRDKKENSFGLIALSSIGPIIVVVILGLTIKSDNLKELVENYNREAPNNYGLDVSASHVFHAILTNFKSILIALGLIFAFFFIINFFYIKLPKKSILMIVFGLIYALFGLVIFLTCAEVGYLPIGFKLGTELAKYPAALASVGFVIGMLTVLAEPAVHVLTKQVDDITMGAISKRTVLIALSCGVGISICLSMIRIICNFSILYYVIPGYLISFGLSFFVPRIYTAIAVDSGGVASGPLTTSFILPIAIGACSIICPNNVFDNGYGVVAMVALTPLITIQLLGFKAVMKNKIVTKSRLKDIEATKSDNIIINF